LDRVLPESVLHPDGCVEPFEPERITRSLFAAAEQLGSADAFLARELTEGVLHFLAADPGGSEIASKDLAETVIKVVRELGHPDLAKAYEHGDAAERKQSRPRVDKQTWPAWLRSDTLPQQLIRAAAQGPLEAFSLTHVFPPDLVSAHLEGLIILTGLPCPLEMAGITLPIPPNRIAESVRSAREIAGEFLAIDGPEHDLASQPGEPAEIAAVYLNELSEAAVQVGLRAVLNLNIQTPPPRLAEAMGPLFAVECVEPDRRRHIAFELADRARESCLTVWWHIPTENRDGFAQLPAACDFVLDRPRGPIHLAPGIDRQTPTTLIQVGMNLSRLVELVGGSPVDPELFLRKVGSLARFAKTAGHVKQDFLRKHGRLSLREAFRLDRARLVLVPLGLVEAARASDRAAAEFGRDILKTIRVAAETDRPRVLPVRVDSPLSDWGGISLPDPDSSLRQQIRAASMLHAAVGAGRLDLATDNREEALRLAAEGSVSRTRFKL
jgi:ATP cone domain